MPIIPATRNPMIIWDSIPIRAICAQSESDVVAVAEEVIGTFLIYLAR